MSMKRSPDSRTQIQEIPNYKISYIKQEEGAVLYDILMHAYRPILDIIRHSQDITILFNPMGGDCVISFHCDDIGVTISARDTREVDAYTKLINKCAEQRALAPFFIEIEKTSRNDPGESRRRLQEIVQKKMKHGVSPTGLTYRPDTSMRTDNKTTMTAVSDSMQKLEIIEDASEIEVTIDFETEMYQLAGDQPDIETAQVLEYDPDGDTVVVYFRMPDESIAKYSYDKPDSTSGELIDLLDVATVVNPILNEDVDLKNVELLVDSIVPIKEVGNSWYINTSATNLEPHAQSDNDEQSKGINENRGELFKLLLIISATICVSILFVDIILSLF